MATSSFLSCNFTALHNVKPSNKKLLFRAHHHAFDPLCHMELNHVDRYSFSGVSCTELSIRLNNVSSKSRDLVVYATPEDSVSSFLPFLNDTPWFAWVGALLVAIPLAVQRLINLSNQVEAVAETVESVADTVGNVADKIDKAADDMLEKLPDGALKNLVDKVEDIAEATSREAQKVEDLMDKVEEASNKVEDFLVETTKKQSTK